MNCKCIEEVNENLKNRNLELSGLAFVFAPKLDIIPFIATKWLDDKAAPKGAKRRPPPMFASHCPFCGVPINANASREA